MSRFDSEEAFAYYVALGAARSYAAVAQHFSVDKKTVTRNAVEQKWQERIEAIEAKARKAQDGKLAETLEQLNERHLRIIRAVQGKALVALKSLPMTSATDAIRALLESVRAERLIAGEPSDRTAIIIEDVIKREHARWMNPGDDDAGDGALAIAAERSGLNNGSALDQGDGDDDTP